MYRREFANAKMIRYGDSVKGKAYYQDDNITAQRRKLEGKPYELSSKITQPAIELGNKYGVDYLLFVNVHDADVFRKTGGIFGAHTTAEELEKGMRGKKVTFEPEYYLVNVKTCRVFEGQNAQKKTALMKNVVVGQQGLESYAAQAEAAVETFGVMDIISRVAVTNLKGEVVQTFPNARHEMLAEIEELLVTPGKVEMIDLGNEFAIEATNEQVIMQQLGANKTTQTNYAACNYLMFMYLTNCNEVIEDNITKKSNAVKVDLSARIIDRRTSKCVFMATGSGTAKAKNTRALGLFKFKTFECPEEQFYEAIKAANHELALKIKERM